MDELDFGAILFACLARQKEPGFFRSELNDAYDRIINFTKRSLNQPEESFAGFPTSSDR